MEDHTGNPLQAGVDVTRAGRVLPTLKTSTELPRGNQQVDVVGSHKALCHANDCALKRRFAMMVRAVLRNVTSQLSDLHVALEVPLEATENDLALSGLEAVHHARDGSHYVVLRKGDQLLVDKVGVSDRRLGVIHGVAVLVRIDPVLAIVCTLLVECQIDGVIVCRTRVLEGHPVVFDVLEVFLALSRSGSTQTFVVLDLPTFPILMVLLPLLIVP
mmetsp:Transcript_129065/g.413561  ORF Transcript_129065/g.413561 Transcript_129065/m.413561 type:complete len:216 (+) Transcript_129065:1571-2218(+)